MEDFEKLNPFWKNRKFRYEVVERERYLRVLLDNEKWMKVLVGARRVGKTYLL